MSTKNNIGKALGDFEADVMEIIWKAEEAVSVSEVVSKLNRKKNVAYTTVMTIMGRLNTKGLLKRQLKGKAYFYKPVYSKDIFLTRISRQIIRNLVSSFGDKAIAHFAEELENIPANKKKKLLKILEEAKNQ